MLHIFFYLNGLFVDEDVVVGVLQATNLFSFLKIIVCKPISNQVLIWKKTIMRRKMYISNVIEKQPTEVFYEKRSS